MNAQVIRKVNSRLEANTSSMKQNPLSVGESIEFKEIVFGESIRGNKVWLKGKNDVNYWSGAFEFDYSGLDISKSSTFNSLGVDQMWKYSKGESVKIGIIDCGLNVKHKALISSTISILDGDVGDPKCTHGNYMSAIICGTDSVSGHVGIAPNAEVFFSSLGDVTKSNPMKLLKCLASLEHCDIVNLSFAIDFPIFKPRDPSTKELIKYIADRSNKGQIFIAATGNEGMQTDKKYYPAGYPGVISVAGFSAINPSMIDNNSNFWEGVDLAGSFSSFFDQSPNASKDFGTHLSGTSITSAVVTSLFGLILSKYNRINSGKPDKSQLLKSFCKKSSLTTRNNQTYLTSMIDKDSIINFLKQ
jgi:subtilisin family serine protease